MLRKSTYTLLIILLILAAVVVFLQRTPGMKIDSASQPTSTQSPQLFSWGDKIVQAILLSDDQGHFFKAKLDNQNKWFIEQPVGCQLEDGKIANSITLLQSMKIMQELETPPALADIGLASPTYRLTMTFGDGSVQILAVGSVVPTGNAYYVQEDRNPVVVVTKYSIDSFFELVSTACATPTPEIIPTNTMEMTLTQALESTSTPKP